MSDYTKTIWECQNGEDSNLIHIGPVNEIGVMEHCVASVHDEANANLIAAAPDMLNALEDLIERLEGEWISCKSARLAIAKAKGELK